jgi:hypothetical protein
VRDVLVLAAALLVTGLPGIVLLLALGVRRPVVLLAAGPGVSVVVAGFVAIVSALVGVRFGAVGVGAAVGALVVAVVLSGRGARRLTRPWAAPVAGSLGAAMILTGVGFAAWSWLTGLGGISTPPQEHDMIIHAMQTAYIARSGVAAPWLLVPADVLSGGPVSFYPSGFHLLAALTAGLTGDIVASINAVTVVLLAIVGPTGVAALTIVAARDLRLGRGTAVLAGGIAALVLAGSYRPGFHLMHDGGIVGNAAALSMVPGAVAALLALPALRRTAAAGPGLAAGGAVWVHPSASMSIGLTVLSWWAGQVMASEGRHRLRELPVPLAITAAVGLVAVLPAVLPGIVTAGRTGAFPPDTGPTSFRDAVGSTFSYPIAGWLDQAQSQSQVWMAVLTVVGAAAVLALRRGSGAVLAWVVWSVVLIGAWLSPAEGFEAPITGFFYNAMLRTWSHVSLVGPVLAGLGVVLVANRLALVVRRRAARVSPPARLVAPVLVIASFLVYALGPAVEYARTNEEAVATRYRTPDFVRVGPDDRAAIDFLAARVTPGERVFNSPNDGSTYLYVLRGVPVVNVYTLGLPGVPYSYELLEDFREYPTDESVREQLRELNVRWVYVDSSAPGIGSNGSPEGWAGSEGFSLAPGLAELEGLPGLVPEFTSGSVTVYSLDLDAVDERASP